MTTGANPPSAGAGATRPGGYGVYYHFDYVGAPRNYKWLNTNQIEKAWQQMDLAYAAGARALWIVNVGDIKPVEFPLSFFMQQAWNPERMGLAELARYPQHWARQAFGDGLAEPVAQLVTLQPARGTPQTRADRCQQLPARRRGPRGTGWRRVWSDGGRVDSLGATDGRRGPGAASAAVGLLPVGGAPHPRDGQPLPALLRWPGTGC